MLLPLQQLLETIYDTPSQHDVNDYLFTHRQHLPASRRSQAAEEEVIVVEESDGATIGVFLDGDLLQRLQKHSPLRQLNGGNVADLWVALEGVSHFAYLAFNIGHDKAVSQLELELQAEVDKYVVTLWLLRAQHPQHFPHELHPLLFRQARIDTRLDAQSQRLYRMASQYAGRFCRMLERTLASDRRSCRDEAVRNLRRFYRLPGLHKLRMIECL